MVILNNETYEDYLKENYDVIFFDESEFKEDCNRIKHIKRLITRYIIYGKDELRERLILNHLIIITNCFGPEATSRIIFFKLRDMLSYIKPFMILIGILPEKIFNVYKESVIDTDDILMDKHIVEVLRKL